MHGSEFRLRTVGSVGKVPTAGSRTGAVVSWPSGVLNAFGDRSHLRHRVVSAMFVAGAFVAVPILDVVAWVMDSRPWATALFRTSSLLFVVAIAMSGAAVVSSLATWEADRSTPSLRIGARRATLPLVTALIATVQLVQRFGPDLPFPGPAVLAADLVLLALLAACGVACAGPLEPAKSEKTI